MMKRVQRKIKKRESGRSMVEMVGVLAVSGLLAAGTYVLITSAMASQKISRAQDDVANIATTIRTMSAAGPDFSNLGCADPLQKRDDASSLIVYEQKAEQKAEQRVEQVNGIQIETPVSPYPCNNKKFLESLHIDPSTPFGSDSYYGIVYDINYPEMFGVRLNGIDKKYCKALNYKNFKDAVAGGCNYTYGVTTSASISSTNNQYTIYFNK